MKKIINIPFLGNKEETYKSILQIRKHYLNDFDIKNSELTLGELEYNENGIPKFGYYKSGIDIVLEKRKFGIKDLLIAKLKLIYVKNENDVISEKNISKINGEIFPIINYKYWMNLNPFYSDAPLLQTMKICLINYASKPGLINDVVEDIQNMSCKTLVSIIENDINEIIKHKLFEDKDKMLRVFDLINGWGGKMGKATYVKPKGTTTRNSSNAWYNHYVNGVKKAINGEDEGLLDFKKIENVGDSFGSKHLYFWSLFGGNAPIPIYDNRIKTLLYFRMSSYPDFNQYVYDMRNFANNNNITIHQLEKALFAFSSNYFPNEELNIKDDFKDITDYDEANRLEDQYNLNN